MAIYHPGERAVQERVGVRAMAEKIGRSIGPFIPSAAHELLREQCTVFLGTVDGAGAVWASVLAGLPGFVRVADARTLRIEATPSAADPLAGNLHDGVAVAVLVVDFATRRRLRVNGTAAISGDAILVHTRQVYWNCPKYIQRRVLEAPGAAAAEGRLIGRGSALTASQRVWVAGADTFVIATAHAEGGVDASHRGGSPGFVRVVGATTICWPDYPGNAMFQTLGNIAVDPAAGLLFLDFERGATLQLTGKARILWEPTRAVELTVERAIEIEGHVPSGWSRAEPSPYNPRD